jgi:hypothetical protein
MENANIFIDEVRKIYHKSPVRTWQNKYWLGGPVQNEP